MALVKRSTKILAIAQLFLAAACTTGRQLKPAREISLEPLFVGAEKDAELGLSVYDARTLLEGGLERQRAGDLKQAVIFFQRLRERFPESEHLPAALFNLGACLEELGRREGAAECWRSIFDNYPHAPQWLPAAFRLGRLLAELGRAEEAVSVLDRYLARPELGVDDWLWGLLERARAHLLMENQWEAESDLRRLLALYKQHERQEYLDPAPAAEAEFMLARLADERFRRAPLRLPEEQMQQDLEQKAELLLEAQAAYLRVVRLGDAYWATEAGYRIGGLYLELHRAMAEAPLPEDLSAEEACTYRRLLAERTAVLLRKALHVLEQTVELAQRSGVRSQTVAVARQEIERIEQQALAAGAKHDCLQPQ